MMIKRFSRHGFTSNHERDARASRGDARASIGVSDVPVDFNKIYFFCKQEIILGNDVKMVGFRRAA